MSSDPHGPARWIRRLTGSGRPSPRPSRRHDALTWADIASAVFEIANGNGGKVVPVSTADYYTSAAGSIVPRPVHSTVDLSKLESAVFRMPDWEEDLGGVPQDALVALKHMGVNAAVL